MLEYLDGLCVSRPATVTRLSISCLALLFQYSVLGSISVSGLVPG